MTYLLGVDAGNTKTIALVADGSGRILGAGRAGCGDIYAGEDAALAAIAGAVQGALSLASLKPHQLDAGGFSMAGVDWPEDAEFLREKLQGMGYGRRITVVNDAVGALRAGSPEGWGVSVVCGTGAATGARSPEGRVWHTSFWQDGQAQGGRSLSEKALAAVCRSELGILPPTALTAPILALFGASDVTALLHVMTRRQGERPEPSRSLSHLLLDVAHGGDQVAADLVRAHGVALGDYALAAARRVGMDDLPFPLVLSGGVLRHPSPLLADAIVDTVQKCSPNARPIRGLREPIEGALAIAAETAGLSPDEDFRNMLKDTAPSASLFETH